MRLNSLNHKNGYLLLVTYNTVMSNELKFQKIIETGTCYVLHITSIVGEW